MTHNHSFRIQGADGVRLNVQRCGRPDGPLVVLLHGFCQSHLAYQHQLDDPLLHDCDMWAPDLRGHGLSDKPVAAPAYQEGRLWADDLAAVIGAAGGRPAVLVAWSYAGYVVADYLAHHGASCIAAVNLVGAPIRKEPALAHAVGAAFKAHVADLCSEDLLATVRGARKLALECTRQAQPEAQLRLAEMVACMTPHTARQAMLARTVVQDASWRELPAPVLISHGRHDTVILPDMVAITRALLPHAQVSWYEDCGHSPFSESPRRFNAELRALIDLASQPKRG